MEISLCNRPVSLDAGSSFLVLSEKNVMIKYERAIPYYKSMLLFICNVTENNHDS